MKAAEPMAFTSTCNMSAQFELLCVRGEKRPTKLMIERRPGHILGDDNFKESDVRYYKHNERSFSSRTSTIILVHTAALR